MLKTMSKTSLAVIGQGFVGGSITTVMSERSFTVYAYDKAGKYATGASSPHHDNSTPTDIKDLVQSIEMNGDLNKSFSGIYVVAVPTPMNLDDGSCDTSIIEGVLDELASIPRDRIALIKSTVPPGSTEKWNKKYEGTGLTICHSPEFLREATALEDQRNQDRIIIGGPKKSVKKVKQLFSQAFPDVPIVQTSSSNSEFSKYLINTFLGTKISFANEVYQLVNALAKTGLDIDYDRIIECAKLDKRLGSSHWQVPSFETDENGNPLYGYSLSCIPKDTNCIIALSKSLGVKPTVLEASWSKNLEVRPGKDWELLTGRAVSDKSKTSYVNVGNRSSEEAQEYAKSKAIELGQTVIPVRK